MRKDDFYLKLLGNVHILIPDLLGPVVPGQYLLLQVRVILRLEVLVSMIADCILNTFLNTLIFLKPLRKILKVVFKKLQFVVGL